MEPGFPISVRFADGEVEEYDDVDELIHNLEDFGSDLGTAWASLRYLWQTECP